MKTLNNLLSEYKKNILPKCPPDKLIHAIYGQKPLEKPVPASNIICSECGGNDGSYILDNCNGLAFRSWKCRLCDGPPQTYFPEKQRNQVGVDHKVTETKIVDPIDEVHQDPSFLSWAKDWVKKPSGFLVISGTNGTGKTFAAEALARRVGGYCSITQAELNISWKMSFEKWGTDFYILNEYSDKKILVLDDLGTRTPTDAFMDFLYALVDRRYRNNDPTIITTNLIHKDLRSKFGDAISSRITSGKCFRFDGKDRRSNEF